MKSFIVAFLILALVLCDYPSQNPIIGIYTQADDTDQPTTQPTSTTAKSNANFYTYIAASYVKFIQMAGAQVVPIFAYSNQSYFDKLLPKLNGVLFPGGGEEININNKWTKNADYILNYALNENKKGNVFPVWGTCLGMQLLAYLTSGYDSKAIQPVRGDLAILNTLNITASSSYLFDGVSVDIKNKLTKGQGILYFNHHYAVIPSFASSNSKFSSFWNTIAITTTSYNDPFLSVTEAKEYPIYAVQFHPEKNLFEWKVFADRTESGVEIVQTFANKFVEKARLNKNRFASYEEFTAASIYAYRSQPSKQSFTQIYLFTEIKSNADNQQKQVQAPQLRKQ